MVKSLLRRSRLHRVMVGTLALLSLAAVSSAQQRSLREGVYLANLRFVGVEAEYPVETLLSADDAAMLIAATEPRSLNYFINGGLPVRAARMRQLIEWGLLRQEGAGFRTLLPVLTGDRAQQLNSIVEAALPSVAAEAALEMQRLSDRVWRHPGVPTLPVLTAWLLRDRVTEHLIGPNGLDLQTRIDEQRAFYPERGFWGVLWYVENPTPPAFDYQEWRRGEYTMQMAWNWGDGDAMFGASDGPVPMIQILGKLRDRGRKLGDREDFPGAVAAGLVDQDGNTLMSAREYRVNDRESLAYLCEEVAVAIAESILRNLDRRTLADLLGVGEEMAVVIAYTELAPRLVAELGGRGLLVRPSDDRAAWRETFETSAEGSTGLPSEARVVGGDAGGAVVMLGLPDYSAVIWRELPTRSLIRIAWW